MINKVSLRECWKAKRRKKFPRAACVYPAQLAACGRGRKGDGEPEMVPSCRGAKKKVLLGPEKNSRTVSTGKAPEAGKPKGAECPKLSILLP